MKRKGLSYKVIFGTALLLFLLIYLALSEFCEIQSKTENVYGENDVVVHFVDVGQADCTLITTPEGNIIIDAGLYDEVYKTTEYIDSLGITDFKYAIFTHPHSDHIGGAGTVITNYNVDTVIIPDVVSSYTPFVKMIEAIENKQCNVREGKAGVSFQLGDVKIDLLAPIHTVTEEENFNNASIVTKITYGEVSFLFTGDAEEFSELAMIDRDTDILDSTILKIGHHGSSSSSSFEFINAVSPEIGIYSCGENNEYGHPHGVTVNRFEKTGVTTYRTDEDGSIVISTDGKKYHVLTEK